MDVATGGHRERHKVDLVLASGRQHQLYVMRGERGVLTLLPVVWSTTTKAWLPLSLYQPVDLAPTSPRYWAAQDLTRGCASCHLSQSYRHVGGRRRAKRVGRPLRQLRELSRRRPRARPASPRRAHRRRVSGPQEPRQRRGVARVRRLPRIPAEALRVPARRGPAAADLRDLAHPRRAAPGRHAAPDELPVPGARPERGVRAEDLEVQGLPRAARPRGQEQARRVCRGGAVQPAVHRLPRGAGRRDEGRRALASQGRRPVRRLSHVLLLDRGRRPAEAADVRSLDLRPPSARVARARHPERLHDVSQGPIPGVVAGRPHEVGVQGRDSAYATGSRRSRWGARRRPGLRGGSWSS